MTRFPAPDAGLRVVLTGGVFGPEDAPLCLVVVAISLAVFVRLAKRRGRWLPARLGRAGAGPADPEPGPA